MHILVNYKALVLFIFTALSLFSNAAERKPNIVFVLTDDQGYGDLSCMGSKDIATPNIDRLANEGMTFTDFYVHNRCSPTRLAFMTGSNADRAGYSKVIYRKSFVGINSDEITTPELLQKAGYKTGLVGKWHLGEWDKFNPVKHGFDYFYGFMDVGTSKKSFVIYENEKVVEKDIGSKTDGKHSQKLLDAGVNFIKKNKENPFFLYYASPLPHTKWMPMDKFKGSSKQGTYGDVIQEIDWQVGALLNTLDELQLTENTLVVFASDNGPQLNVKKPGSAGPLRDGKWSNFEGGIRVPCLMRWPKVIKAKTTNNQITAIFDLLPTFSEVAGVKVPNDRKIDGKSILAYMKGEKLAQPIHETFIVSGSAIRYKHWKLAIKILGPGGSGRKDIPGAKAGSLFNLQDDIGERTDVSANHPELVDQMNKMMKSLMKELKENSRVIGKVPVDPKLLKKSKK
ncbi:MAG: sulfatase-like hydrolase/transferase [Lentisphaeraceae bacterium]|nr:sulfatase-like hydrolase/transferase [Lentisphaeraceae bacterium]